METRTLEALATAMAKELRNNPAAYPIKLKGLPTSYALSSAKLFGENAWAARDADAMIDDTTSGITIIDYCEVCIKVIFQEARNRRQAKNYSNNSI